MRIHVLLLFICGIGFHTLQAQLFINEGCNRNGSLIVDEDGDYEDWIEIYNAGPTNVDLTGYALSDTATEPFKWLMPEVIIPANEHLLFFTSGKDRKPVVISDHWEQPVTDTATWKYIIPSAPITDWTSMAFDDGSWSSGQSSIGYGDDDDAVVVPNGTVSVYMRYTFFVPDVTLIHEALLSMDYDDGFVAYLNGHAIAMFGFGVGYPAFDALSGSDHESAMYGGGVPENFLFPADSVAAWLLPGENVLAIEVHNVSTTSSDLTARPFLSLSLLVPDIIWSDVLPWWFNLAPTSSNFHTNFQIGNAGEMVFLTAPDGSFIDSMFVGTEDADQSVGRASDGAPEVGIFVTPTPDAANSGTVYDGYTEGIVGFSLEPGFYTGDQIVSVTIPAGTIGHYTINGEIPDISSPVYTTPVTIDETTVFRVRIFDEAGVLLPGETFTNTYFIDETVTVPVISLSTNVDNLYGPNGVFENWWNDWKKLGHIEYFDNTGLNAFEQDCGFKVDGGAGGSRSNAQKSMRIEPDNAAYGDGNIHYPLIPRRSYINTYETFYLRNGSNMHNVLPYKDAFMMRTTEGTLNEHMSYTPVVVFINGIYWGYYELRNKLDDGHFENAKGIEKDSLDLISVSFWYGLVLRAVDGSIVDFVDMRNYLGNYPTPEDTAFYAIADSLLDVKQFTDYIIAETWFGNLDWPYNNIKAWQDRGGDNRWKYAIIDAELALGIGAWSDANLDLIPGLFSTQQYIEPLAKLLQNPIYREYFVNRYADLMNTTFLPERTLAMEDSMYMEVLPEMPRQLERWGAGDVDDQMATFENYRSALRSDFEVRSNNVRTHIKNGFELEKKVNITLDVFPPEAGYIKISTIYIDEMPWTGVYFDGVPVQITAYPNPGYTFENWYASPFIDDIFNPTFKENITLNTTFTASFSGAPVDVDVTVSEINYHPEPTVDAGNWVELWNNTASPVDISLWKFRDNNFLHQFTIPEGTILAADARLVLVEDSVMFLAQHPEVDNYLGNLNFGLANFGEELFLFDRKDALQLHFTYGDDLPWPVGADGHGRTLERRSPDMPVEAPSSWFDGCIGGSPGLPYTPCDGPVIFSEINYHPNPDFNTGDWVELRNITDAAVDISGWTFMDDSSGVDHVFTIPDGTWIEPYAHRVLAQSGTDFFAQFPGLLHVDTSFNFNLSDGGEWIRMYNNDSILVLSVDYNDDAPWSTVADGAGYTLELIDSSGIMNDADNWTSICYGGSPDAYIAEPCEEPLTIENALTEASMFITPNPAGDLTQLILDLDQSASLQISIYDITGTRLMDWPQIQVEAGKHYVPIETKGLPAGVYSIVAVSGLRQLSTQFIKQ